MFAIIAIVIFFVILILCGLGLSLPSLHLILMGSFVVAEVMLVAWMIKRSCLIFRRDDASWKDE
jgi:cytochrome b subunit of formate dehydrogenase